MRLKIKFLKKLRYLKYGEGHAYFCLNVLYFFYMKFCVFTFLLTLKHIADLLGPCILQVWIFTESGQINIPVWEIGLERYRAKGENLYHNNKKTLVKKKNHTLKEIGKKITWTQHMHELNKANNKEGFISCQIKGKRKIQVCFNKPRNQKKNWSIHRNLVCFI